MLVTDFDPDALKTCRACRIKSKGRSKRRRQAHQLNHTPANTTAPELPQSIAGASDADTGSDLPELPQVIQNTAAYPPAPEVHHNTPANSTTMDFTHTTPAIPTASELNPETLANPTGLPPAVSVPSLNDQWLGVSPDGNDQDLSEGLAALFDDEDFWQSIAVCVETPTGEGSAAEGDDSVDAEAAADALSQLHISSKAGKNTHRGECFCCVLASI